MCRYCGVNTTSWLCWGRIVYLFRCFNNSVTDWVMIQVVVLVGSVVLSSLSISIKLVACYSPYSNRVIWIQIIVSNYVKELISTLVLLWSPNWSYNFTISYNDPNVISHGSDYIFPVQKSRNVETSLHTPIAIECFISAHRTSACNSHIYSTRDSPIIRLTSKSSTDEHWAVMASHSEPDDLLPTYMYTMTSHYITLH